MPPSTITDLSRFTQLAPGPVSIVSSAGNDRWLAAGRAGGYTQLTVGSIESGEARIWGGFEWVTGLHALDEHSALLTNGSTVVKVHLPEPEITNRVELPAVREAWGARFSGSGELTAFVITARLSVLGSAHKSAFAATGELEEPDYFTAVELLPSARAILVGRGDGRLEIRDEQTLEPTRVLRPLPPSFGPPSHRFCVLSDESVAVSDGSRCTGILSLSSGSFERFDYEDTVVGLHRLPDGRLAVVAPRRILVYAGTARQVDADFAPALSAAAGHQIFNHSAICGSTLLLACGQGGLRALLVSDLPMAPPPTAAEIDGPKLLQRLQAALSAKADVEDLVAEILRLDNPTLFYGSFALLAKHGVPLEAAPVYLQSPLPSVRSAVVRHMTTFGRHFHAHAKHVKPLLEDTVANIRFLAVFALHSIGDPAAIEWLQPLRSDPAIGQAELERVLSELAAR